jgi:Ca2+-binding EF-hand superfamily protein
MFFVLLTLVNKANKTKWYSIEKYKFDLDNSGKIDFKEFLQAINITSQGTPEKKLEMAFRMYDCNGDGSIDETEMRRIISVSWISKKKINLLNFQRLFMN